MLPLLFAASARHLTGLNDLRGAQSIFSVIDQAIDQAIDIDDDSSCPQTTAMASQKWAAQF